MPARKIKAVGSTGFSCVARMYAFFASSFLPAALYVLPSDDRAIDLSKPEGRDSAQFIAHSIAREKAKSVCVTFFLSLKIEPNASHEKASVGFNLTAC